VRRRREREKRGKGKFSLLPIANPAELSGGYFKESDTNDERKTA